MKDKLDKYITENYQKLVCIAQNKVTYYGRRHIDAEGMVNDAYIYVTKNLPDNEEDIPKYLVKYMDTELKYTRSATNKTNRINNIQTDQLPINDETVDMIKEIEMRLSFEEFRESLDIYDQIVWDVYYKKGKTKLIELSEHFDIPISTINVYRQRILSKLKAHESKKRVFKHNNHSKER